jgi:hypothetical protein
MDATKRVTVKEKAQVGGKERVDQFLERSTYVRRESILRSLRWVGGGHKIDAFFGVFGVFWLSSNLDGWCCFLVVVGLRQLVL